MNRKSFIKFATIFALSAFLATGYFQNTAPASAATNTPDWFFVNSTADQTDAAPGDGKCKSAAGKCTLRAAVQETNALGGYKQISLPNGVYTLQIGGIDDAAAKGDLDIKSNLNLIGQDETKTIIDGNGLDRVFQNASSEFSAGYVTVRNGAAGNQNGGGIWNGGSLTLNHVILTQNSATKGGALFNQGSVYGTNVSLDSNTASQGGGVFNSNSANIEMQSATLARNHATQSGGGAWNQGTYLRLFNSTVALNRADNHGGGIYSANTNQGNTVGMKFTTISQNTADDDQTGGGDGGGIYNEDGATAALGMVILAGNTDKTISPNPSYQPHDCFGTLDGTSGNNLLGNSHGCLGIGNSNSNQFGTPAHPLLPKLAALAANGGPTQTMLPMNDSPAHDSITFESCAGDVNGIDQRGYVRAKPCDTGAAEAGSVCGAVPDYSAQQFSPMDGKKLKRTNVKLQWFKADCADTYSIVVRRDAPNGTKVFTGNNLDATSVVAPLVKGHSYYWTVKACNTTNCQTSNVWTFKIK